MGEPMALRRHDGNDRDELFLCLLRIKFWVLNLLRKGLDNRAILSYNTTPAEEGRSSSPLLAAWLFLTTCLSSLNMSLTTCVGWSVLLCSICFYSPLSCISSLHAERFSSASTTRKQDHMPIIRHSDLTTSLTINRSGVHGDKSVREYEKAVFA